jgi:hypothetical protein
MAITDIIGIAGFIQLISAYFLLQADKVKQHDRLYLFLNISASTCILVSLIGAWNLPSFLIQCFWIAISLYGLWKHHRTQP